MAQRAQRWRAAALLYGAVALGSAGGSALRWLAGALVGALAGAAFPWGTLFVNITGSAAIGFYAELSGVGGRVFAGPRTRQMVMSGACGGYTTFSLFSLESLRMLQRGAVLEASAYVSASLVLCLAAVWLGDALAARLNRLKKGPS
jgi:fluoride exporter